MKMYIWCSHCETKIRVYGQIWQHRLRYSKRDPDHPECFAGWHCDSCANAIESGMDY